MTDIIVGTAFLLLGIINLTNGFRDGGPKSFIDWVAIIFGVLCFPVAVFRFTDAMIGG